MTMPRVGAISNFALVLGSCATFESTGTDATDAGTVVPSDAATGNDASATDAGGSNGGLVVFLTLLGYADVVNGAGADTKCNAEAQGRRSGRFVAWYSDPTVSALDRLVDTHGARVQGPWFRIDGKRVVASRDALVNTAVTPLENPIDITITGTLQTGGVWTATRADGKRGTGCPSGVNPTSGDSESVDHSWTEQSFFTTTCGTVLSLYCFQVE